MPLFKKTRPAPARPAPTLSQRLDAGVSHRAGAEGLVAAGARQLKDVSLELDQVAKDAFDAAAKLSVIGNQATAHAAQAADRSDAAHALIGTTSD